MAIRTDKNGKKILNDYTLAETRVPGKSITLEYRKRYRATYHNGKVLEFCYDGSPKYNPTIVWCSNVWNVTNRTHTSYCSEWASDFVKVECID